MQGEILSYVMNLARILTKYHKKYMKELEITPVVEPYIQSKVLKSTFESIFFDYR